MALCWGACGRGCPLTQRVSVVAEKCVEPAVAVGGVPVGVRRMSAGGAALWPVDHTAPRTGDIDIGDVKGTPPALPGDVPVSREGSWLASPEYLLSLIHI